MFRSLDADKIIATLETLSKRVNERFPRSGLAGLSVELTQVATRSTEQIASIARPNYGIRALSCAVVLVGLGVLAWLAIAALQLETSTELTNVMQGLDSTMSLLIVFGGGAFYLSTLEQRWRRVRALKALHELRSIVHVIDMHQLTKDPSALGTPRTSSSPERSMTSHQLLRYFAYCSELLSLASKIAALYADKLNDPVIVEAVGDIERLSSNLSQKVWQKIQLIEDRMAQPIVAGAQKIVSAPQQSSHPQST